VDALTFKQYLNLSKEQLHLAAKQVPKQVVEYSVRKYCKIPLGESKETKEYVNLKPSNIIRVEWLYEDLDNPTPVRIILAGTDDPTQYSTFWQGSKLLQWLNRNTRTLKAKH